MSTSTPARAPDQTTITFSCPPELKEQVKAAAQKENRNVSNFLVARLFEYLEASKTQKLPPWSVLQDVSKP